MRISQWWCADCRKEDRDRLYGLLSSLSIGDLFIYKVCKTTSGAGYAEKIQCEYAVMQRTACKMDFDEGNTVRSYYDSMVQLTRDTCTKFYDFFNFRRSAVADSRPYIFYSLDDPELILELAIAGIDAKDLPVFEISYDDRTVVLDKDKTNFFIIF